MEDRARAESRAAEAAEQAARAKEEAEFANQTAMLAVKEAMETEPASQPSSGKSGDAGGGENDKDRTVLTAYLRENYPEKIGEVDTLLKDFAGNLDVLFAELSKDQKFEESPERKGGEEVGTKTSTTANNNNKKASVVAVSGSSPTSQRDYSVSLDAMGARRGEKSFLAPGVDLREVVVRFYGIFAPSKLRDIDDILKHFDNREADLFRTLEVKYDVTFTADGMCTPNDAALVERDGSRSMSVSAGGGVGSKFAVSQADIALKERLKLQGVDKAKIDTALSGGSGMM